MNIELIELNMAMVMVGASRGSRSSARRASDPRMNWKLEAKCILHCSLHYIVS